MVIKTKKIFSPLRWTKKLTLVGIVLDKSGSMLSLRQQAIDGFNEQLQELQSRVTDRHEILATVTLFSSDVESQTDLINVEDVPRLTQSRYRPDGMTAMYDAVGETIATLKQAEIPPRTNVAYLVVVISDGMENYSKEYNSTTIRNAVSSCQETGKWTFVYIGANQDLSKVSKDLSIPTANMLAFNATPEGYKRASYVQGSALSYYLDARTLGVTNTVNFFTETTGSTGSNDNKK
jgi:hypothetical protein